MKKRVVTQIFKTKEQPKTFDFKGKIKDFLRNNQKNDKDIEKIDFSIAIVIQSELRHGDGFFPEPESGTIVGVATIFHPTARLYNKKPYIEMCHYCVSSHKQSDYIELFESTKKLVKEKFPKKEVLYAYVHNGVYENATQKNALNLCGFVQVGCKQERQKITYQKDENSPIICKPRRTANNQDGDSSVKKHSDKYKNVSPIHDLGKDFFFTSLVDDKHKKEEIITSLYEDRIKLTSNGKSHKWKKGEIV